jgi:hypothetical protein
MKNEKDDDVQNFATCTYCGTQTGLSFKHLEGDKPLKCRACGAPLEVVPPAKPPEKAKKAKRDFGRLIDDPVWGEYWRERRTDYVEAAGKAIAIIIAAALVFFCIVIQFFCD